MKPVLIVRKFDDFSRILSENNFSVINCPTIETVPSDDLSDFSAKLETIDNFDGLFITSLTAAEIFRRTLQEKNVTFRGKIYVFGKRAFDLLKRDALDPVFDENANTALEMLENLSSEKLKDKRFLFVRGEKSMRSVPDFLSKIATVEETIVYRTEKVPVEIDKIKAISEMIKKNEIACAVFFSPSGAESFLEQFGLENLHQIRIASIGKTTADYLKKRNLKVDFIASKPTAKDFAIEFIEYIKYFEQKFTIY